MLYTPENRQPCTKGVHVVPGERLVETNGAEIAGCEDEEWEQVLRLRALVHDLVWKRSHRGAAPSQLVIS